MQSIGRLIGWLARMLAMSIYLSRVCFYPRNPRLPADLHSKSGFALVMSIQLDNVPCKLNIVMLAEGWTLIKPVYLSNFHFTKPIFIKKKFNFF